MSRALLILNSPEARAKAKYWIDMAPWGWSVLFRGPKRTLSQNDIFWGHVRDIARQVEWYGVYLPPDQWKIIFMDALDRYCAELDEGQAKDRVKFVPNLDGTGLVRIGSSSSSLDKEEFSHLLHIVTEFADRHGVRLSCAPL